MDGVSWSVLLRLVAAALVAPCRRLTWPYALKLTDGRAIARGRNMNARVVGIRSHPRSRRRRRTALKSQSRHNQHEAVATTRVIDLPPRGNRRRSDLRGHENPSFVE